MKPEIVQKRAEKKLHKAINLLNEYNKKTIFCKYVIEPVFHK